MARGLRILAQGALGLADQPLKALCVDLFEADLQHIPRPGSSHRDLTASSAEQLPDPRDIDLNRVHSARWTALAPQPINQPLSRDRLGRLDQQ
jgi:hypothetical protein